MCKIIALFSFFTFISLSTYSAGRKLNYEFGMEKSKNPLSQLNASYGDSLERIKSGITYSEDDIYNLLSMSVNLRMEKPDNSSLVIRDENGNETFYQDIDNEKAKDLEYYSNVNLTFAKGAISYTLGADLPLNDPVIENRSFNSSFKYAFFNGTTILGVGGNYGTTKKPLTHFSDPVTFFIKPRATDFETKSYNFNLEQVLNSISKVSVNFKQQLANVERPANHQIGSKIAIALKENIFVKAGFSYAKEKEQLVINSDRGFYKNRGARFEILYEPMFDLFLSASYDFVSEDLKNPFNQSINRTGVDQYGVGIKYQWSYNLVSNLQASYAETNTNLNSFNAVGGIEWSL